MVAYVSKAHKYLHHSCILLHNSDGFFFRFRLRIVQFLVKKQQVTNNSQPSLQNYKFLSVITVSHHRSPLICFHNMYIHLIKQSAMIDPMGFHPAEGLLSD